MTMIRVHGKLGCHLCSRFPATAWLYACTQEHELDQIMPTPLISIVAPPMVDDAPDAFNMMAQVAEGYHMHPYIVKGIREREYTVSQVNKLVGQKENVFATIKAEDGSSSTCTPTDHPQIQGQQRDSAFISAVNACAAEHGIARNGMPLTAANTSTSHPASNTNTTPTKSGAIFTRHCTFMVCHSCRPFFIDRTYMSFETAMSGQRTALTEKEMLHLPLLDPFITRHLGLQSRPLPELPQTLQTQDSTNMTAVLTTTDDDTDDLSPDTAMTTDSELETLDMREAYPCPGRFHCQYWNPLHGCAYDNGFDDGLRALNHGFGPDPDLCRMTPENSTNSLRFAFGSIADTPGSMTSTTTSNSIPTPKTPSIIVTPMPTMDGEQSFGDSPHLRLSRVGKAASVSGARLDTIDEVFGEPSPRAASFLGVGLHGKISDDIFGRPLRNRLSSSSVGSEVSVEGGVALTEEAVVNASPDVATDNTND